MILRGHATEVFLACSDPTTQETLGEFFFFFFFGGGGGGGGGGLRASGLGFGADRPFPKSGAPLVKP